MLSISRNKLRRLARRRTTFEPPTVVSLLLLTGLMVASLAIPQRSESRLARGDEVGAPNLAPARPRNAISLRDRLITGLQARLTSEIDFVDTVVSEVHAGRLPQRLVDQTFFWARTAAARRERYYGRERRPIIYFRPAMTLQARRIGVTL